ncbi:predicted protein [Postia placenta Mad-698-R]|nr:predicted protein [Postia placenta Mad-698-R]
MAFPSATLWPTGIFATTFVKPFVNGYLKQYCTDHWSYANWHIVVRNVVLDTLCVVISFHIVYYYVITSYSNPSNLLMGVWSFKAHQVAGIYFDITIALFPYLTGVFRIVAATIGMGALICLYHTLRSTRCVGQNAGASTLLARQYPSALRGLPANSETSSTDSIITIIMIYTLNTGALTSLCSLAGIIGIKIGPHTYAIAAIEISLAKPMSLSKGIGFLATRLRLSYMSPPLRAFRQKFIQMALTLLRIGRLSIEAKAPLVV